MVKNFLYQSSDEINFIKIIKNLWKEKFLILIVTIISVLIFYFVSVVYEKVAGKKYKIEFSVNYRSSQLFYDFAEKFYDDFSNDSKFVRFSNNNSIYSNFVNKLVLNLTNLDNIDIFVEQSKDFDELKLLLIKKNLSAKQYFLKTKSSLEQIKNKDNKYDNKYIFIYPETLDGKFFLINYFEFIENKTFDLFIQDFKIYVKSKVKSAEDALLIAKSVGLKKPLNIDTSTNPKDLFYVGTDALEAKIREYKEFLIYIENSTLLNSNSLSQFNVDTFYDEYRGYSNFFYALLGLLFGFILSFFIIFFKSLFKENK